MNYCSRCASLGAEIEAAQSALADHLRSNPSHDVDDRRQRERDCTGLAATWCPVHGNCSCGMELRHREEFSEDCPLHGKNAEHATVSEQEFAASQRPAPEGPSDTAPIDWFVKIGEGARRHRLMSRLTIETMRMLSIVMREEWDAALARARGERGGG